MKRNSPTLLFSIVSLSLAAFYNLTFLKNVFATYPQHIYFQVSIFIVLWALYFLLLNVFAVSKAIKPLIIIILLFSSLHAYFTDSFGIIGDENMIRNILKTDLGEAIDLFSIKLVFYFILLGVTPSALLFMLPSPNQNLKMAISTRFKNSILAIFVILGTVLLFSKSYASFFREHKPLRYYSIPGYFIYSSVKLVKESFAAGAEPFQIIGEDANINLTDTERELVIFVVGETARSDRFSINGYERETNPLLKNEEIYSFRDVYSCGTSTATSVPCMFSIFGRNAFDHKKAEDTENLVDVLEHTKLVNVLWRDNNSNSKGVAIRVPYEDFKDPVHNTMCDEECRDEGMLVGLQGFIDRHPKGDIFIILHQMGNHGPAYYKRYPVNFEYFKPTCKSSDLGDCTGEEINNAYDNAIRYTDYFLSKVIGLLKQNDGRFETAMFYVSDHGESLGENGVYLHGLPYSIAPVEQRKVPFVIWLGPSIRHDINLADLKSKLGNQYTHDNIFHTVLRLLEVNTHIYDKSKDILEYNEELEH